MERIEILFAEFGGKFQPDCQNVLEYFLEADINVYDESDCKSMFDRNSPYWGKYMNDYWKVRKLLESEADVAISLDADMKIVSNDVVVLAALTEKFGLCLPANPRLTVRKDTLIGSHSDGKLDETKGLGYAVNMSPIAFDTSNSDARKVLDTFCRLMLKNPVRGPLNMWRAIWGQGFFPCLLPPQWCVCGEDIGVDDPIILHIGHEKVRKHYGV